MTTIMSTIMTTIMTTIMSTIMTTSITIIASLCLIIFAVRIKINNSKEAKKDAENFMGVINPLMYKDYGNNY